MGLQNSLPPLQNPRSATVQMLNGLLALRPCTSLVHCTAHPRGEGSLLADGRLGTRLPARAWLVYSGWSSRRGFTKFGHGQAEHFRHASRAPNPTLASRSHAFSEGGEGLVNCLYATCSRCRNSCKPIRLQDLATSRVHRLRSFRCL